VPFVKGTARVHRIPPRVRDDGQRPFVGRDGGGYKLICVFGKSEYFLRRNWTNKSPAMN
jgi:hypothetical protein